MARKVKEEKTRPFLVSFIYRDNCQLVEHVVAMKPRWAKKIEKVFERVRERTHDILGPDGEDGDFSVGLYYAPKVKTYSEFVASLKDYLRDQLDEAGVSFCELCEGPVIDEQLLDRGTLECYDILCSLCIAKHKKECKKCRIYARKTSV